MTPDQAYAIAETMEFLPMRATVTVKLDMKTVTMLILAAASVCDNHNWQDDGKDDNWHAIKQLASRATAALRADHTLQAKLGKDATAALARLFAGEC